MRIFVRIFARILFPIESGPRCVNRLLSMSLPSIAFQDDEDDEPLYNVTVPISMSITVMVSYICGGALLFAEWEGWGFLDGSYFCFITLR